MQQQHTEPFVSLDGEPTEFQSLVDHVAVCFKEVVPALRRLKTLQGLADSTQLETFREQAQQELQRLHKPLSCICTDSTTAHAMEIGMIATYQHWTQHPATDPQQDGFGAAAALAAVHVQLVGLLGELQHSMAAPPNSTSNSVAQQPEDSQDSILKQAWQPLAAALPAALHMLSMYCSTLAKPDVEMPPHGAQHEHVWLQPELPLFVACVVLAYTGRQLARVFLELPEREQQHREDADVEEAAPAPSSSSSSSSLGVAGEAEGRLRARADMLQSQEACEAQLAAMLPHSGAVFAQQWERLGLGGCNGVDAVTTPLMSSSSSGVGGNDTSQCGSSDSLSDPGNSTGQEFLYGDEACALTEQLCEAVHGAARMLQAAVKQHSTSSPHIKQQTGPLAMMLLCSASPVVALCHRGGVSAATACKVAGGCMEVALELIRLMPSAAAAAAVDGGGGAAAAARQHYYTQIRQLTGQHLQLLHQLMHIVLPRLEAEGSSSCDGSSSGSSNSISSDGGSGSATDAEPQQEDDQLLVCQAWAQAMTKGFKVLGRLTQPLHEKEHLAASLQQPQHINQLVSLMQTAEAVVRWLGAGTCQTLSPRQQHLELICLRRRLPASQALIHALGGEDTDLKHKFTALHGLANQMVTAVAYIVDDPGWELVRHTEPGQQLLRASLSMYFTTFKCTSGMFAAQTLQIIAPLAQEKIMCHMSRDLRAAGEGLCRPRTWREACATAAAKAAKASAQPAGDGQQQEQKQQEQQEQQQEEPVLPPSPDPALVGAVLAAAARHYLYLAEELELCMSRAGDGLAELMTVTLNRNSHTPLLTAYYAAIPGDAQSAAALGMRLPFTTYAAQVRELLQDIQLYRGRTSLACQLDERYPLTPKSSGSSSGGNVANTTSSSSSSSSSSSNNAANVSSTSTTSGSSSSEEIVDMPLNPLMLHLWRNSNATLIALSQAHRLAKAALAAAAPAMQARHRAHSDMLHEVRQLTLKFEGISEQQQRHQRRARVSDNSNKKARKLKQQSDKLAQDIVELKGELEGVLPRLLPAPRPQLEKLMLELHRMAQLLNIAVPSSYTCNTLGCTNMLSCSEAFGLVAGKGCVCGGCVSAAAAAAAPEAGTPAIAARYCSVECQAAHFPIHKLVCPAFTRHKEPSSAQVDALLAAAGAAQRTADGSSQEN